MSSRASWQLAQEGSSAGTPQPSDEAEVALAPMTAVAIAERASKMFVVSAAGPQRSGLPPAARKVNKELCLLAFNAANDLCNEHGTDVFKPWCAPVAKSLKSCQCAVLSVMSFLDIFPTCMHTERVATMPFQNHHTRP